MFTCLCIGDPHFCKRNLNYIDKITEQIINAANKLKPDFVIIMGDLLDSHEKANVYIYNKAVSLIERLIENNHYVILLIGNHDRPNNSDFMSDNHFFTPLKKWENVLIVDKTTDFELKNHRIICVPYVPPGKFNDALKNINDININKPRVIFCHQEFYGVNLGPTKSKNGDKWDINNPLIISGHIHNYHWLQENILYCGSPYQIKYNDSDDKSILYCVFDDDFNFNNTRYRLKLPIKRDCSINIENFNDQTLQKLIDFKTDDDIRLIFTGDLNLIKLNQNKIFKSLSNKFKICFKPDFNTKDLLFDFNNPDISNRSFDDIFYDIIKKNDDALNVYNQLFVNI